MADSPPEDQPKSDPAPAELQAAKSEAAARAEAGEVSVNTLAQYVKDLSFENPNAPDILQEEYDPPNVRLDVGLDTEKVGKDTYEVVLDVHAAAVSGEKTLFLVELTYCGLFSLSNVREDQVEQVLRIPCASLLFPFARHIVADATRNGGYPPLLITLVDFNQMYRQHQRGRRQRKKKTEENGD